MNIVSIADPKYYAYLRAFVKSAQNKLSAYFHCTLVNMADEAEYVLRLDDPELVVTHEKYIGNHLEDYCTNSRTRLLTDARTTHTGPIFWMDATTIVRKPCDLVELMDDADVLVYEKPKEPGRYLTGVLGLSESPYIKEFLEKWDAITKEHMDNWFANQSLFPQALSFFKNKLKIKQLPIEYIDWKFGDSFIWTGKGRKVRCDKRWKDAMKENGVGWEYPGSDPLSEKDYGKL